MSNIIPFDAIEKMADAVTASKLFGVSTKDQALALMLIAQAEGMHPATAARDYHVINGRPTLKADTMLARFMSAGGSVEWIEYTEKKCEAKFSHPQGGSVKVAWTIEQASKIMNKVYKQGVCVGQTSLTDKDVWKQYPRQMLRSRVISEGIRTIFPGVAVGVYTPEEAEDFHEQPKHVAAKIIESNPIDQSDEKIAALLKESTESLEKGFYKCKSWIWTLNSEERELLKKPAFAEWRTKYNAAKKLEEGTVLDNLNEREPGEEG